MSWSSIIALLGAMVILAAIPSVSVLAVSSRAAASGFIHGAFTAFGIVLGDIIFIVIAIWGLSFLTETLGELSVFIKYLGGTYLIILGISLCRAKSRDLEAKQENQSSLLASFLTGLFITLGDQKATLFYLGFLPAFLDISQISYLDTAIVVAITIVAVGGVKLFYAFMAHKARSLLRFHSTGINRIAGAVMVAVGIVVLSKS